MFLVIKGAYIMKSLIEIFFLSCELDNVNV